MPPVTPVMGQYDSATIILNAARFRLKSQLKSLYPTSGAILDETQPGTQQATNNAYRRLQDDLCDAGAERFSGDVIITGIPPVQNFNTGVMNYISWTEVFDGINYSAAPVLPSNLIIPLWMSERQTGTNFAFPDPNRPNMTCYTDGLPMGRKCQGNGCWEWREDKIYYPGATLGMDFRIRYRGYLPDIIDVGTTRWFNQPVQIMRCSDSMAWWICHEFASQAAAGDPDNAGNYLEIASACKLEAIEATKKLVNRDVMKNERVNQRRIPYGGGNRRDWGTGY